MSEAQVFETPDGIEYFQLCSGKASIKLEKVGMTHSSGKSVKAHWQRHFRMPRGSSHDAVIAMIQQRLDFLLAAKGLDITSGQLQALCEYVEKHGEEWRGKLLESWMSGGDHGPELQQVRNRKGPVWLSKITLDFTRVT